MPDLRLRVTGRDDNYTTLIATEANADEDGAQAFAGALAVSTAWADRSLLADVEVGGWIEVEVPARSPAS